MAKFRGQWSGQWVFVLAASGAAIGLGNIWKFPYMAGDNGGSSFVLLYLLCGVDWFARDGSRNSDWASGAKKFH